MMITNGGTKVRWSHLLLATCGLFLAAAGGTLLAADPPAFELRDGDRVAFLGGTFVERLQVEGYFETELTSAFPDRNLTFRNLGWSGDTVWGDSRGVFGDRADGFKRLINDTLMAKPTVLAIAYGQNESFAGKAGVNDFKDGLSKLIEALAPSKARMVLIAPPQAIPVPPPLPPVDEYNRNLALYRDAIKDVAAEYDLPWIDWYGLVPPKRPRINVDEPLTLNGIHWTPVMEWLMAPKMAESFGAPARKLSIRVDFQTGDAVGTGGQVTGKLAGEKVSLEIMPERVLPPFFRTRRSKNGFALFPPSPPSLSLQVLGIGNGNCEIRIGNRSPITVDAEILENGMPLPSFHTGTQTDKLRKVIRDKNELFFHRYRPQNETYLFLFRKHEQGNNAVEIPQFDPLIEAKEKEIANLRQPQPFQIEISRK